MRQAIFIAALLTGKRIIGKARVFGTMLTPPAALGEKGRHFFEREAFQCAKDIHALTALIVSKGKAAVYAKSTAWGMRTCLTFFIDGCHLRFGNPRKSRRNMQDRTDACRSGVQHEGVVCSDKVRWKTFGL